MVNINAILPPAIAAPFHPPTENLQRDNLIKPVIPKTDIISSYTKMREDEHNAQFSDQARAIVQDESSSKEQSESQQQSAPDKRRSLFFARRSELSQADKGASQLAGIKDFKLVISVIQERYRKAVSPNPEPTVNYAV